jgi:hypothetical protein
VFTKYRSGDDHRGADDCLSEPTPINNETSRFECAYLSSTTVTDQDELESGGFSSHDEN